MNNAKPALGGKNSKELLQEVGMEIIRESSEDSSSSPELRAAAAIPAIMEIIEGIDQKFHRTIFKAVIDLHGLAHDEVINPWVVADKPAPPVRVEKKRWFCF